MKFYLYLVSIIFALFIGNYEPTNADQDGNMQFNEHGAQELVDGLDPITSIKQTVQNAVSSQPGLYDLNEVNQFLNDQTGWQATRYLNQRNHSWRRAAQLAIKNLRWRAQTGLSKLNAAMFPCDLFKLGLIFEHGVSNQLTDVDGSTVGGNPVIWIRLGALGNIVKQMEKLTSKRIISFAYNSAKKVEHKTMGLLMKHLLNNQQRIPEGNPIIEDMSLKNDQTIQYVLSAITWFLNDWEQRHPARTKATLVLDFENTDFAFSSWSMGEFFVGLDDHFPDLFDQILGFRFKPKVWSLHSPISMFNRIFKSRISSSPETDRKLKFINKEPELTEYITRADINGFSRLPDYIYGDCLGQVNQFPAGCQIDKNALAASQLYNPQLLQAIENEFYQVCRPRIHKV